MSYGASALDIFDILDGLVPEPEPTPPAPTPWTEEDFAEFTQDFESLSPPEPVRECRADTVPINSGSLEEYAFLNHEEVQRATLRLAQGLLQKGPYSLVNMPSFEGNGIYAIYYHGDESLYEPLRSPGSTCPIYIGKAAQCGIRSALAVRLRDHIQSIRATNIGVENLSFRFVCLPPNLIEFAESNLISTYQPLWNVCLLGFGRRVGQRESSARPEQYVSRWDTLHSGRPTVSERPREVEEVETEVRAAIPGILEAYHDVMKRLELAEYLIQGDP